MGTETMVAGGDGGGGAVGIQRHHYQPQQRQSHNLLHNSMPQQPYLIDGEAGAFGDAMKCSSPPQADAFGHPRQQQPQQHHLAGSLTTGTGVKFPPVVGIYRPPAARRALRLAESIVHQLAPPAACEHPNDYGHLTPSGQHPATATAGSLDVPDKGFSASDSREGHRVLGTGDETGVCEKTGPDRREAAVQQVAVGSESSGSIGSSSIGVTSPSSRTNRPHRERRPDRAVYVPRARRSLTTPPVTTTPSQAPPAESISSVSKTNTSDSPPKRLSRTDSNRVQLAEPGTVPAETVAEEAAASSSTESSNERVELKESKNKPRLPVAQADDTRQLLKRCNTDALGLCDTVTDSSSSHLPLPEVAGVVSFEAFKKRSYSLEEQQQQPRIAKEHPNGDFLVNDCAKHTAPDEVSNNVAPEYEQSEVPETLETMHRNNQRNRSARGPTTTGSMLITDPNDAAEKIDRDEKELRRASQEINRSNRRIMKQTFNSDVLEIDEPTPPVVPKPVKEKITVSAAASVASEPVEAAVVSNGGSAVNDGEEEEDDWESMYDDNGDCLNPKMLDELTSAVGKVSIETPQMDYKSYQSKQAVLNEEEFPHVLEVSNFPAEFKTQDLMMLFSQYKESGFDIKWVDDTHALAVFSSSKIAAEVLTTGLTFARVKPLAEATAESRTKARKCSSSLQPYRPRPETCAAMARRMVSSALGVKLKTAPEERENERRVLREAKERKRLAAKQRDEVWDS
uniref:R3H domain-containing protein n=2 Tax=Anopheles farauti TaxID=69004 RepID=A0A3F2YWY2_9DIPT